MILFYTVLISLILLLAYIRLAPSNPDDWHQDPEFAASTNKPNQYRLAGDKAPVFDIAGAELAELVNDFAISQPRIKPMAGTVDALMITYVERSMIMGYPDYITIKITPLGPDQSKLSVFSRSRFGHSDLGVNKRRTLQWIAAIKGLVARR